MLSRLLVQTICWSSLAVTSQWLHQAVCQRYPLSQQACRTCQLRVLLCEVMAPAMSLSTAWRLCSKAVCLQCLAAKATQPRQLCCTVPAMSIQGEGCTRSPRCGIVLHAAAQSARDSTCTAQSTLPVSLSCGLDVDIGVACSVVRCCRHAVQGYSPFLVQGLWHICLAAAAYPALEQQQHPGAG